MANAQPRIDRTSIIDDIKAWDAITDHRTGSAGDAQTDLWLSDTMQRAGCKTEVVHYPFARVDVTACWVQADQGERISGVPMFDATSTGPYPVEGMAHRDVAISRCAPFDAHPLTLATQDLRLNSSHTAIVAVSAAAGVRPGLALLNAERYRAPFGPPVVQVSSTDGAQLLGEATGNVRVLADFLRTPATATNVQTHIRGSDPAAAPVVIMTPKSGWWTCTAERVGGIVVWLALIRHFTAHRPRRTVMFTANSGHELSHLGLDHYLQAHPSLAQRAHVWLHLGANFAAAGGRVRVQASDEAGLVALTHALDEQRVTGYDTSKLGERPLGEARNIFDQGGRFLSILGSNPWFHQPADRFPGSIDVDKAVAATGALVTLMHDIVNA